MKYAICQVSVSPMRREASDTSEMVNQILFGEKMLVLESQKKWYKVQLSYEQYEGWVDPKQIFILSEEEYNSTIINCYASDSFNLAVEKTLPLTLTMGACLPNLQKDQFYFGSKQFDYMGDFMTGKQPKETLVTLSKSYLNVPYLWGGKSTFGIDCSGLVQQVFKLCGYKLPRDAHQQAELGEVLSFMEETEAGDLAFFDNEEGKIIHVGIIIEPGKIVHAHGKVRIDPIDSTGIFNTDQQQYSHRLRCLKRIW